MRIIAGIHRSRPLQTLPGLNTRPMMDQMKESIFNTIGPYFDNEIVLDLFGGSGALSLEAISRGASLAYIVDESKDAIKVINNNIQSLKEENKTKVFNISYSQALTRFKDSNIKFDIIFLDPPFSMHIITDLVNCIIDYDLLNFGGIIICQYVKDTHNPEEITGLEIMKNKLYGQNEVCIYQKTLD